MADCSCANLRSDSIAPHCDCALPVVEIDPTALWAATEAWGPVLHDGPAVQPTDFRHAPPPWVLMSGPPGPPGPPGPAGSLAAILLCVALSAGMIDGVNDDVSAHGQLLTPGSAYPP